MYGVFAIAGFLLLCSGVFYMLFNTDSERLQWRVLMLLSALTIAAFAAGGYLWYLAGMPTIDDHHRRCD